MQVLPTNAHDFWDQLKAFCPSVGSDDRLNDVVRELLAAIQERGDAAVLEATARFDGATLEPAQMVVSAAELEGAANALTPEQRLAMDGAIANVEAFHRETFPRSWRSTNAHGATIGERFYPIRRVGLYIPGGNVPLVSTVVMSAVLARLAGCPEVVVTTPPRPDGSIDAGLLAALHACGVREVYRVGGIQAIGALAYGTDTIPAVDKIFGPGNAYVMEAKRQVLGTVGIDLLPGPSEVMVIADAQADSALVAADLLAQAEHGSGKEKVYGVVASAEQAAAVAAEMEAQRTRLRHAEAIARVMERGTLLMVAGNLAEAVEVANFVAPEHLELHVDESVQEELLGSITTAGAILLGAQTPTVLGDFTAGPSHTLPTGRTGRFFSGLRLEDFFRRTSFAKYDAESLPKAAPVVRTFAELEQLDAHGESLERRLRELGDV